MSKKKQDDWFEEDEPTREPIRGVKQPDPVLTPNDPPAVDPIPPLPESKELTALKVQIDKNKVLEADADRIINETAEQICENKNNRSKVRELCNRLNIVNAALSNQTGQFITAEETLKKAAAELSKSFTS